MPTAPTPINLKGILKLVLGIFPVTNAQNAMIALIMAAHYCPLGRLCGKGDGIRQELGGWEATAISMTECRGAQGTQAQCRLVSESRGPIQKSIDSRSRRSDIKATPGSNSPDSHQWLQTEDRHDRLAHELSRAASSCRLGS